LITAILGKSGNYAQWAACIVFVLATIATAIHSTFVHRKSRTFHLVTTLLSAITALSYYAAATGSGKGMIGPIKTPHHGEHADLYFREISYARFIEWFFTTPLILLNPALLAGLAWIDVFTMLILDEMMIVCALMGAFITTSW
jgi:bacteriorhodopsin